MKLRPNSCYPCKFLYLSDQGYSNYTVEQTHVLCALDLNGKLPADKPYDWNVEANSNSRTEDNWPITSTARCQQFKELSKPHPEGMVHFDVDGENQITDMSNDLEQILFIKKHCGNLSVGDEIRLKVMIARQEANSAKAD